MPSSQFNWKRQFNSVDEDDNEIDKVLPIHCEEVFHQGIKFKTKVILLILFKFILQKILYLVLHKINIPYFLSS